MAKVVAVCISAQKGNVKHEVDRIDLKEHYGIIGDAHAGNWHRQISLLAEESVDKMRKRFPDIPAGVFAENILTRGIALSELPIGTKLKIGNAVLEITQIGKECHTDCAIRQQVGDCVMPREGVFAVVVEESSIRKGDEITVIY